METIKELLRTDDTFMYKSLVTLYYFQTEDEKAYKTTAHVNGLGFNYVDAEFLSSLAEFVLKNGYLTEAQKKHARTKLIKYAGQIEKLLSSGGVLADVELKEAPVVTQRKKTISITVGDADKCNGKYSLFISFEYDYEIVSLIKKLETRWYHNDTHVWEVPTALLNNVKELLSAYDLKITGEEVLAEKKQEIELPKEFTFKTTPFKHQIDGIVFGLEHDKWLLADTMGLGKTKCAIDLAIIKKFQKGYKHCLIVCGVNGLKWNWVDEIKTHSSESSYILGQRERAGKIQVMGNKEKLEDLSNFKAIPAYFIITNIESLRDEKIVAELKRLCSNKEINMIVLDEAHMCKNPSSQQGKGILKLSTESMLAMTGTPLMNNPVDLYVIMKWLGYEKHSFYRFKNHYCVMGGYGGYEIIGYKNLEQLQRELDEIMLRRLKEQVYDLPDKIYVDEFVELTPKQKQIYDEVTQSIKMNIDKIITAPNPLAELIRMRQATGYTGILSTKVLESAKIDRLVELLAEAKSNNQKVVIFSNWTQMTDPVESRLNKEGFKGLKITGETKDNIRQQYVDAFQHDSSIDYIVGTIGAMGTGITLTAGTIEVFLDEPWNKALKEQAVDRCHRIGTTKNVTVYTLMAKNTIDERIHDIVESKGLMSDAIVDGKIKMNTKEILNYLIG